MMSMMLQVMDVLAFVVGLTNVAFTLSSAIRTFVLPRAENVFLTALVFRIVWPFFRWRVRRARTEEQSDRQLAMFAPYTLLLLPVVWLALTLFGFMGMFWAVGVKPWSEAFLMSGSSLLTLGFAPVSNLAETILAFFDATIGLILIALLIAYLPTMYNAFARRENLVARLEIYAGTPPSPLEILARMNRIKGIDSMHELFILWETWFAEIEEAQTTFGPLNFFRSPKIGRSWVAASGAVLDSAALLLSVVDGPRDPRAALCIRAGYLALQSIADFFDFEFDHEPAPTDPISISRDEFDEALDQLKAGGLKLKSDRDQAWLSFSGWRVNYDAPLLALASITAAPRSLWTGDRAKMLPQSNKLIKIR